VLLFASVNNFFASKFERKRLTVPLSESKLAKARMFSERLELPIQFKQGTVACIPEASK